MALATDYEVLQFFLKTLTVVNVAPVGEAARTLPCRVFGQQEQQLNNIEEWMQFSHLGGPNLPTRANVERRVMCLELILYSVHSQLRKDEKFAREYELAAIFKPYLNVQRYVIGTTCIVVKECRVDYLDLRSLGDFANTVKQRSPKTDISSAVILAEAEIYENKSS